MIDYERYDKAIIITWDWDFACLVKYLKNKWKLRTLIVPNFKKYSYFLKKEWWHLIDSLSNKREILEYFDKK
jgi:predicted nuclease of predicted toxin-antitoxin system